MKAKPAVVVGGLLAAALPWAFAGAETWRNHFDVDGLSRPPAFFDFVVLGNPGKAAWAVLADENPPSPPNKVFQAVGDRPEGSVAAALRRNVSLQDGRVTVFVKRTAARGGLVLRLTPAKDCLLLLVDADTGKARLSSFRGGKATELASGQGAVNRAWGKLGVVLSGAEVRATWNDAPLFSAADPAPAAGRVGIATEGPGRASFDEFVIDDGKSP